ncbi:unnamed protein product [Amoebophrya sp. A120]|nr:unnamed protein product [Amoebophrya sp. A120]|eukprot:GSA120T00026396001.1
MIHLTPPASNLLESPLQKAAIFGIKLMPETRLFRVKSP